MPPKVDLGDLPLNAKLNTELAHSELAERIRDDPERNEHSGEENAGAAKDSILRLGRF